MVFTTQTKNTFPDHCETGFETVHRIQKRKQMTTDTQYVKIKKHRKNTECEKKNPKPEHIV